LVLGSVACQSSMYFIWEAMKPAILCMKFIICLRAWSYCERHACEQVSGDDHVPAGKHTWHAEAAPVKLPWATSEAALVNMQRQLLQQHAGGLGEAMEAQKRVPTLLQADSNSLYKARCLAY
jgi:hypothetical protein